MASNRNSGKGTEGSKAIQPINVNGIEQSSLTIMSPDDQRRVLVTLLRDFRKDTIRVSGDVNHAIYFTTEIFAKTGNTAGVYFYSEGYNAFGGKERNVRLVTDASQVDPNDAWMFKHTRELYVRGSINMGEILGVKVDPKRIVRIRDTFYSAHYTAGDRKGQNIILSRNRANDGYAYVKSAEHPTDSPEELTLYSLVVKYVSRVTAGVKPINDRVSVFPLKDGQPFNASKITLYGEYLRGMNRTDALHTAYVNMLKADNADTE